MAGSAVRPLGSDGDERQDLVDGPDGTGPLAHGGGDPFHGARADVAGGEDPGLTGLEGQRAPVEGRPCGAQVDAVELRYR